MFDPPAVKVSAPVPVMLPVLVPVPPSATARSVIPVIVPPVAVILSAQTFAQRVPVTPRSCDESADGRMSALAMTLPLPLGVSVMSVSDPPEVNVNAPVPVIDPLLVPVPPSATARSVIPVIVPPVAVMLSAQTFNHRVPVAPRSCDESADGNTSALAITLPVPLGVNVMFVSVPPAVKVNAAVPVMLPVLLPVPPSATARSVMPVIVPPEIETLLASCVAIVPSPSDVRAVAPFSATQFVPSPTAKLPSITASPARSSS